MDNSQLKEIKTQLRMAMNGTASASMREKGLAYKLNFGVELPRLKQIAAQYEKNHELAQALWKENIRECKILAGMLQPVDSFYPEIMDIWIDDMPTVEIAEMTCMHLFQYLPYAPQKSLQLIADEREYQQICGFLIIARPTPIKSAAFSSSNFSASDDVLIPPVRIIGTLTPLLAAILNFLK